MGGGRGFGEILETARWEAAMLECATVGAELEVFSEMLQLGLPRGREVAQRSLGIMVPNTVDAWRAARCELEVRLFAVGFSDPEARVLLPDRGEGAHRAAHGRYRGKTGTTARRAQMSLRRRRQSWCCGRRPRSPRATSGAAR